MSTCYCWLISLQKRERKNRASWGKQSQGAKKASETLASFDQEELWGQGQYSCWDSMRLTSNYPIDKSLECPRWIPVSVHALRSDQCRASSMASLAPKITTSTNTSPPTYSPPIRCLHCAVLPHKWPHTVVAPFSTGHSQRSWVLV